MRRETLVVSVLLAVTLAAGCSNSSGRGGSASSASGVTSASAPAPTTSGATTAPIVTQAPIVNTFAATGLGGVYSVSGTDAARGAYSGQVELRWEGSDYSYVREVEYTTGPTASSTTGRTSTSTGAGPTCFV
ncbi:MAG: hypothetical protein JKY65_09540 [Planctomycetes bacterium]|nr:hypothetical protein [Planctomycetota bacterium]